VVKPSVAFWRWLVEGPTRAPDKGWQVRGGVKLSTVELLSLLGPAFAADLAAGGVAVESASVWAGAGSTRTPLHVDMVHALVFQVPSMQ